MDGEPKRVGASVVDECTGDLVRQRDPPPAGNPDDARKALQTLAAEPQMLTTDALRALHCGAEAEVALHGGNPKAGSAKAAPRGTPLARGRLARGRGRNAHAPRRMHDEKR